MSDDTLNYGRSINLKHTPMRFDQDALNMRHTTKPSINQGLALVAQSVPK